MRDVPWFQEDPEAVKNGVGLNEVPREKKQSFGFIQKKNRTLTSAPAEMRRLPAVDFCTDLYTAEGCKSESSTELVQDP